MFKLLSAIRHIWNGATAARPSATHAPPAADAALFGANLSDFRVYVRDNLHTKDDANAAVETLHAHIELARVERERIYGMFKETGKFGEDYFDATAGLSATMEELGRRKIYIAEKFGLSATPSAAPQSRPASP